MKTAFSFSVNGASAPMLAVEKFSAQPRIEGPTKSKMAAMIPAYDSTTALRPPRLPATRISVVARASGKGSFPCRSRTK